MRNNTLFVAQLAVLQYESSFESQAIVAQLGAKGGVLSTMRESHEFNSDYFLGYYRFHEPVPKQALEPHPAGT